MSLPAAFVSVIMIWSTTPLAIKWSAVGVGFSFALLSRMGVSALLCVLLMGLWRVRFPLHRAAVQSYLASGLTMCGTMLLTYWAAQYVSSGMISVLYGLSPLLTSLAAALWLKEEALTPAKLTGMALGLLGLILVFQGGLGLGSGALLGVAALFVAVTLQSLGLVWLKRINDDSPPLAMTLGTLIVALPLFFIVWLISDGLWPESPPQRTLAAIFYLGVFGSVIGFSLYYYMIKNMEAGRIALITLVTPVLALLLGRMLNDEQILPHVWLGTASIVLGLGVHRWGGQWMAIVFGARRS
ncbi:MAG: DMT family transporter [Pseudomonadota bacterium]